MADLDYITCDSSRNCRTVDQPYPLDHLPTTQDIHKETSPYYLVCKIIIVLLNGVIFTFNFRSSMGTLVNLNLEMCVLLFFFSILT